MHIIIYFITLLTLALIDSAWLFSMGAQYKSWLGHLFAPQVNFIPVIFFYLIYTFGLVYFVVMPGVKSGNSLVAVFLAGALFGLVAYATYDLTNHATMQSWPLVVTLVDMLWGAFLTGISSVIAIVIVNYVK